MGRLETLKVIRKSDGASCLINKADFDKELHKRADAPKAAPKAAEPAPEAEPPKAKRPRGRKPRD